MKLGLEGQWIFKKSKGILLWVQTHLHILNNRFLENCILHEVFSHTNVSQGLQCTKFKVGEHVYGSRKVNSVSYIVLFLYLFVIKCVSKVISYGPLLCSHHQTEHHRWIAYFAIIVMLFALYCVQSCRKKRSCSIFYVAV
jgi:membrane protein CcdC involved in cytochrome C biogenesis